MAAEESRCKCEEALRKGRNALCEPAPRLCEGIVLLHVERGLVSEREDEVFECFGMGCRGEQCGRQTNIIIQAIAHAMYGPVASRVTVSCNPLESEGEGVGKVKVKF